MNDLHIWLRIWVANICLYMLMYFSCISSFKFFMGRHHAKSRTPVFSPKYLSDVLSPENYSTPNEGGFSFIDFESSILSSWSAISLGSFSACPLPPVITGVLMWIIHVYKGFRTFSNSAFQSNWPFLTFMFYTEQRHKLKVRQWGLSQKMEVWTVSCKAGRHSSSLHSIPFININRSFIEVQL